MSSNLLKNIIIFVICFIFIMIFDYPVRGETINQLCLECHQGSLDIEDYNISKHGKMECIVCHKSKDIIPHPDNLAGKEQEMKISESCNKCHYEQANDYKSSIHEGIANCIDCHGSHYIKDKDDPQALTNPMNNDEVCGRCHSGRVLKSYLGGFHGIAVNLGSKRSASCVSCHSAHNVLSGINENSITHPDNVGEMCSNCHGKAVEAFATWDPHALPEKSDTGIYSWYALKIFTWLIIGTITFFLVYIILDLASQLRGLRKE